VPRRASVACSTPSSLVRGDDRGDAAVRYTGTGRPRSVRVGCRVRTLRTEIIDSLAKARAWPEVADGPIDGRHGGTPGDDALVGQPNTDAPPGAKDAPTTEWTATPLGRRASCPRRVLIASHLHPSLLARSSDSSVPAVDEDRESFQATLRLGTLGGRIRPVKRPLSTMCARMNTHRDRPHGGILRKTR
jgi:hypothetical protein